VDSLDGSSNVVGKTIYSYSQNQSGVGIYQNASTHTDTETHYDGYGRADRIAVYNGQSANYWYQQDSCFDANGRLSVKSYPYASTGFNVSKVCSAVDGDTYTYDALGRTKTITHSDGTAINYSYNGRATETIDENGVTRITQVDFLGRPTIVCEVTSSTLPMSGGAPGSCGTDISATGYSTTYSYNLATLTTTINQGGQTRSFQTDSLGRTISVTEPESGTTTYSYAYNSTGLVMTRKRPTANQTNAAVLTTTTTQYDALGRVVNISYSDGTSPKRFSYDTSLGWPTLAQANLKGRLAGAVGVVNSAGNATAGTVYSYDSLGRITSMDECLPSACGNTIYDRVLNYSYDWQGNLLTSSDGASTITTYGAYSPAAEVGSITTNLTGIAYPQQSLVSSTVNGPYGPISFYLGNGLSQYNGYTQLGQNHGEWICPGAPSARCTGGLYGFMAQWKGSNVISFNDSLMGNNNVNSYDPLNRLSAVSYNAGATTVSYTYDRWGNRLAQNAQSGPSPSYTFNTANNQITTMSYDALGNVLNDGFHSYLYDAENNVIKVDSGNTAVYTYDAMNRRVRVDQSSGSQEFVFNSSGQRVSVWNPATQTEVESQFYWGGTPIAFYTPASGQVYFQHQDWVGTERARTTYNGAIAGRFLSLPFGDNFTVAAGTDADANHFAGLDQDSSSSTSHAQFRQYSNTQGRWMSPDPYYGSYDLSNPQSLNRYAYVLNSPLSLFDHSGLILCDWGSSDLGGEDYDDDADCANDGGSVVSAGTTVDVTPDGNGSGVTLLTSQQSTAFVEKFTLSNPSNIGCNTVLPNGKTVGQYINQGRAQMQASVNASGSLNGALLTTFASIAMDYGQIDFKNGAGGSSVLASRAQLGQAGNFAYYAIGSGYLSPGLLDAGAGAYAVTSALLGKKPFSTLTGPMFSDASAASVRNAGLATPGCP
jgi:RHS repeat-associated protein